MGLIDEIRLHGAATRLTEEALYAEALREFQSGARREGLWARALAETAFDEQLARATYLKLRVQALKDELVVSARVAQLRAASQAQERNRIGRSEAPVQIAPRKLTKTEKILHLLFVAAFGISLAVAALLSMCTSK